MEKFKNNLLKYANAVQNNLYMKSISSAMMSLMPIMMVSSIASLIGAIDIGGTAAFMEKIGLKAILDQINNMTINVVSIYVAFLIAYKIGQNLKADALNCGIMGVMSFLILTPLSVTDSLKGLSTTALGSGGMFVAMLGGCLGGRLYVLFMDKKLVIKMPESVPPVVSKSFASIIPGALVAAIMGLIYQIMSLTPYGDVTSLIYAIVQAPLASLGANIFASMLIVAFIELLWFFGIHGVLAVYPILMLVFYEPQLANLAAYGAGEALPYIFTMGFILNNRGARSLAVSILCIFNSKSAQLKAVGKVGLVPAAFQISEPIKFGIPQVMNLRMLFPLMITPAVSVLSAYILTIIGFLPYHNGVSVPTGFPAIFCGFLFNGWQGIIAQLIQLGLCTIIYIPFIKSQDKFYLEQEKQAAEQSESKASMA